MASGKRASMREGPLAALFRKTEEDAKQAADLPADDPAAERAPSAGRRAPDPTPVDEIPPREAPHPSLSHPSAPLDDDRALHPVAAGPPALGLLLRASREPARALDARRRT